MTLNVGQDFKKRWLNAPDTVHQTFLDDLSRICDLLTPESDIQQWLTHDQHAMQIAQLKVEQAYADLKARLIEEARIRKQQALEKSLADKRAQQQAYNQQLQQDEIQQFQAQTASLAVLRQSIDQQIKNYSERYGSNADQPGHNSNALSSLSAEQVSRGRESVKLRLELEAEALIEQTVAAFRTRLQSVADEEISYMLKNADNSER
ncbi:cell division protein BlhA [Acinetobacter sp. WZC-1]|uniref:cell division protein BlhA n=1 Tax=Acinetobacter sp. WZC-1 TaxID=3459034 RepID=UPI00403D8188